MKAPGPPSLWRDRLQRLRGRVERTLPVALAQRFFETGLMTQAASLSFYALLSLAPLLVLLLWMTASLYPPAQESLVQQIGALAGDSASTVARTIIRNADEQPDIGSLAGWWSTGLLFVGATVVFAQLQGALNLIFRTDAHRLSGLLAWLRKRVFSLGVVLAIGFLLVLSMVATTALQVAFARLPSVLPALSYATTLLLYALAFAFFYHYLPDRRVGWRHALLGGLITAGLFSLGRYLIGLYLAQAAPGSAYGSMGALVLLLVWIYYACVVFFIGALLTAVIDERRRGLDEDDDDDDEAETAKA
jgi:membrane protein